MRKIRPTVFVHESYEYVCDTCIPLKRAIKDKKIIWTGFKRGRYPGDNFESDELENVRLCAFWNSLIKQTWGLPYHRNEGLEIGFVEKGFAEFSSDKQTGYSCINSDFFTVTKPWQEHAIGNPTLGVCKMYFVIIDFGVRRHNQDWKWPAWVSLSKADKLEFSEYMKNTGQVIFKSTPTLKSVFKRLGVILEQNSPQAHISELSLIYNTILFELLCAFRGDPKEPIQHSPNEAVVKYFIDQLENYCAEQWTLESMAEDCGLKSTRFSHYCQKLSGHSPMQLLNSARLNKARKMLESGEKNLSITDIAYTCGFTSSQYFSTKFREAFGSSPREYLIKSIKNSK